jgi:hypothetical protein
VSAAPGRRVLRLEIPIESDEELAAFEGALLAARASELSQIRPPCRSSLLRLRQ